MHENIQANISIKQCSYPWWSVVFLQHRQPLLFWTVLKCFLSSRLSRFSRHVGHVLSFDIWLVCQLLLPQLFRGSDDASLGLTLSYNLKDRVRSKMHISSRLEMIWAKSRNALYRWYWQALEDVKLLHGPVC